MEASSAERLVTPYRIGEIAYSDLPAVWDAISSMLEKACEESFGAFTPKSVVDGMREGEFIMLGIADEGDVIVSILVCCVGVFGSGLRVLEVALLGGEDMRAWLPFEEQLDTFARARGCHRVRCVGRKSLERVLPHWKRIGVMLERVI